MTKERKEEKSKKWNIWNKNGEERRKGKLKKKEERKIC